MNKVTVMGSVNMDISICADSFPKLGETITGYDFHVQPGGKGSNQAITIGKLLGDVCFLGCVGDDTHGQILHQTLKEYNVDISHVETIKNQTSGTAVIFVCNGDNSIVVNGGANECMLSNLVEKHVSAIEESKILLTQLEIPTETILTGFRIAKNKGLTTILNPAPIKELSTELLKQTDIIILNQTEAQALTGHSMNTVEEAKEGVKLLLQRGLKIAVITLGSQGCVFSDEEENVEYYPARKVKAVDTTGAGDSFCGAFAYALANDFSIKDAIRIATVVSSVTVTRRGAALSTPTKDEVNSILREEGTLYELS